MPPRAFVPAAPPIRWPRRPRRRSFWYAYEAPSGRAYMPQSPGAIAGVVPAPAPRESQLIKPALGRVVLPTIAMG